MKKILGGLFIIIMAVAVLGGCAPAEEMKETSALLLEDDLGREVSIAAAKRVGIATGSLAECWILAGGMPVAVTRDAIEERDIGLSEDVINMGSLNDPSMEVILSSNQDLLILNAALKPHLELDETLTQAGIPHAYFDIETFDDYLRVLKLFTELTGRDDLYEKNGEEIEEQVKRVIEETRLEASPKILILRTSASKVTARNSDSMVGQMLKNMGCTNIADNEASILEELSLEVIAEEDPEYIFIICRGDEEEARTTLEEVMESNPIWGTLSAVKNNKCYYLEKELFHYKPTVRWGESYEVLASILSEDK